MTKPFASIIFKFYPKTFNYNVSKINQQVSYGVSWLGISSLLHKPGSRSERTDGTSHSRTTTQLPSVDRYAQLVSLLCDQIYGIKYLELGERV